MFTTTVYHGSAWEKPLLFDDKFIDNNLIFNNLSTEKNELNVFFVSESEDVCEFFSDIKVEYDNNLFMQMMLEIKMSATKVFEQTFEFDKEIEYKDKSYHYDNNFDRKELYAELKKDGYQAMIVNNDYKTINGMDGNDIAIIDESCVRSERVKLKINDTWTKYMSYQEAKLHYLKWAKEEDEEEIETDSNKNDDFYGNVLNDYMSF